MVIKIENQSEIITPLQKNGKHFFTPFQYNTMYGFTLTIELIIRHYGRLSLFLILQSNNLYRCLNYIIVYNNKKVIYIFSHLYIHILTTFDEFQKMLEISFQRLTWGF